MICRKLFTLVVALLPSASWSASLFPDTYDKEFKTSSIHLPVGTDWRLLKAQCFQESRLKRFAVSPVGAMGVCQFMPLTWLDMKKKHSTLTSPWLPSQSIRAAALYMKQLNNSWSSPRPQSERYKLALASYNAGFGNILKSQRQCNNEVYYQPIINCLHCVTGHHSEETINYVKHINRFYKVMVSTGN